jgi:DNA mismatch repair protein MutS
VAVRETAEGIAFLRVVLPGSMNRSYGIQVARLAGLPQAVVDRAMLVLEQLTTQVVTSGRRKRRAVRLTPPDQAEQLALFGASRHPLLDHLRALDIARLTPLEALTMLSQWQDMLRAEEPSAGDRTLRTGTRAAGVASHHPV